MLACYTLSIKYSYKNSALAALHGDNGSWFKIKGRKYFCDLIIWFNFTW